MADKGSADSDLLHEDMNGVLCELASSARTAPAVLSTTGGGLHAAVHALAVCSSDTHAGPINVRCAAEWPWADTWH